MFGKISHRLAAVSLPVVTVLAPLVAVSGCSASSSPDGLSPTAQAAPAQQATPVIQAFCPQIVMLEQTAVYRAYAKGGKANGKPGSPGAGPAAGQDNPDNLQFQASLADATRQCTANDSAVTVNVVVQGRIVEGPAGSPGQTTLPVLVEVVDGDKVLSSQRVPTPVTIPTGGTQFIFNSSVQMPNIEGGASRFTRVRVGFDTGPAKTGPGKKPGKRG